MAKMSNVVCVCVYALDTNTYTYKPDTKVH